MQENGLPWIEKYRPKKLDDIILDEHTMNKIKQIQKAKNMRNLIITGVPGIGKTTTIQCIAKELLGKHYENGTIELNASDDRGIKAIQDTIINFCKKKLDLNKDDEQEYASHKIIILDEADNMTIKAQHLINTLMGDYDKTTRFAFTCNNSSDIIEAIQSRCIIFRYSRLSNKQVVDRLEQICKIEKVIYTRIALNNIAIISQGDMRNAVNILQLVNTAYGEISVANIESICDKPRPQIIKEFFKECQNKNYKEALQLIHQLKRSGFGGSDIMLSMTNVLKSHDLTEIDDATKIKFLEKISRTSYIISKGIDTDLQLSSCVASMCDF